MSLQLMKELGDDNLEIKTSSGSSKVYLSKSDDTVFQKFISSEVSERIANIMLTLLDKKEITYEVKMQKGFGPKKEILIQTTLKYDPFKYIVPFKFYIPRENVIAWKKIVPLNSNPNYMSEGFLTKNFLKIFYDISKALVALRTINIIHNDCVLDNIGIYKGNFVLFDFDGSGTPEVKQKNFSYDYETLIKSFRFREVLIPNMDKIKGIVSIIEYTMNIYTLSAKDAFQFLEKLVIQDTET